MPDRFRWVTRAWRALEGDRAWIGGGLGRPLPGVLPFVAVRAYAEHCGYGPEKLELLRMLLRAMDAEYRAWHARQAQLEGQNR